MRLVCPSCGAIASAEAWTNDTAIRFFFEALVQLPSPVLRQGLAYLGLFRKGKNALPWKSALVLTRSLKALIETGTVQWDGGEVRPCTPDLWGKAIEETITAHPQGIKNHNYLRSVAWSMAADLAAKTEEAREQARRKRTREKDDEGPVPMSAESQKAIENLKKQWGER